MSNKRVAWIKDCKACRAVVVGGGYIGLEMAEQLRHRGLGVTVVEALSQVMTPLDPEMAAWLHGELKSCGHVPNAVNIPLGELRESLPRRVKDKSQVLLLHCLSGGRSGIAQQQIKGMGYQNVFNLGSYGRARQIVGRVRVN